MPRNWEQIRAMWVRYSQAAGSPGVAPSVEIGDLVDLRQHLSGLEGPHPKNIDADIPGLRVGVLKEALFSLQKAAYTLVSGRHGADATFGCPSLATAYQAAYLAMRSIVGLLGVAHVPWRSKSRHYLVDVFSERIKGATKTMGHQYYIRLIETEGQSVGHREMWFVFKRLLSRTRYQAQLLPLDLVATLLQHGETDYGWQRNHIHYRLPYWPFDEVRESLLPSDLVAIHVPLP